MNAKTPRKLSIAIFMDDFYPNSGGVARSIENQVHELKKAGHDVVLFAPRQFLVQPIDCRSVPLDTWYIPGTPSFLCSLRFSRKRAEAIVKDFNFDVVHSQNERGSMFLASHISKIANIPHVHTFHSNYAGIHSTSPFMAFINSYTYMQIAPRILRFIRRDRDRLRVRFPRKLASKERSHLGRKDWKAIAKMAQFTDAFTSPADYVIASINDATHDDLTDRAFVIANGIGGVFGRAKRIRRMDDTVRFLVCGRFDPEKRVDVIIKAFAKLHKSDAELYLLGSGTEEARLRRLAAKVDTGRIEFLGHYEDPERIANEYANADCFVFASYHFDTQGMVLAEAAASGCPILYCDERLKVGVTPKNALLTHPSITAISEGMRTIYGDPKMRLHMSKAGKMLAPLLTTEAMEKKFIEVYRTAIARYDILKIRK